MKTLEVNSSAISNFSFNYSTNRVGVVFRYNPEKCYLFDCADIVAAEERLMGAESVGKMVAEMRKDGTLTSIEV